MLLCTACVLNAMTKMENTSMEYYCNYTSTPYSQKETEKVTKEVADAFNALCGGIISTIIDGAVPNLTPLPAVGGIMQWARHYMLIMCFNGKKYAPGEALRVWGTLLENRVEDLADPGVLDAIMEYHHLTYVGICADLNV